MRLMMERMTTRMTTPWLDDCSPRGRASSYRTVMYCTRLYIYTVIPYRTVVLRFISTNRVQSPDVQWIGVGNIEGN